MKPKSFPLFSIARTAFLATLTATSLASAATFTWDADGVAPLNDGAATWNATGGTNWNTGATYGTWGTTTADEAVFGVNSGAAGIVTVGTVTANKLTFNAPGPTKVAGGTLGGTTTLGNVSVANLAALEGGAGAPGTLTAADVTLGSGAADTTSLRGKLSATAGYQALAVTNLTLNGGNLVLSYKRTDASETDTTQTGQWSTDLSNWHDLAPVQVSENSDQPDDMTIGIPLSNATGGKLFGRPHVIKP